MNKAMLAAPAAVMESEHEAVLVVSRGLVIRSHNDAALRALGRDWSTLVGRRFKELFVEQTEAAQTWKSLERRVDGEAYIDFEAHVPRAGGVPARLPFRAFPIAVTRREIGFVVVSRASAAACRSDEQSLALLPQEDPNPVLRISAEGRLQYANRGSWMLLTHWRTEVGEQVPRDWIGIVRETLENGEVRELEIEVGFKVLYIVIVPIAEKGYVNVYGLDVTRRRHVEEKLRLNVQVFENATEGIMIADAELRVVDVNRAFCRITGYPREEILGEHVSVLNSDRHEPAFYERLWSNAARSGSWQGEVWDRRRNGEIYPKWLSVSTVTGDDGEISRYLAIFSDISALKRTEEQLYRLAHYDSLTGLVNRRYFLEIAQGVLRNSARCESSAAVMFIDLDGFKLVNDTMGHATGDRLLQEVAKRVKECLRESDTVARLGGDEFTAVLPNLADANDAATIARKLLRRIAEPLVIDSREVLVSPSIGVAFYPDDGATAEVLLQRADAAMYRAKEAGKNGYQFFSPDMNARTEEQLSILSKLRRAIAENQFVLHYQPQVDLADGRISGLEALVRWSLPGRGLVGPALFVPIAEENGLIAEIGELVLRSACRQAAEWRAAGLAPVRIAVNISARQLGRADFFLVVRGVFEETGIDPRLVDFELTERVLLEDDPDTLRTLKQLRALGVSLTIDDFGTKYSSLGYLRQLPINRLKIDRTFVRDLTASSGGSGIVSAIVAMARNLKLDAVAEGVETQAQARILQSLGCPHAQGFCFGAPADADETRARLELSQRPSP